MRRPPTIVPTARPRPVQPRNGVFTDLLSKASGSTVHSDLEIEDRHVGDGAGREGAPGQAHEPRRAATQQVDAVRQVEVPGSYEAVEAERDRGLEPDDAEGSDVEGHALLVGVVRRVVGGDRVDAAVGEAGEQGLAVGFATQGRVHLEVGRQAAFQDVHRR